MNIPDPTLMPVWANFNEPHGPMHGPGDCNEIALRLLSTIIETPTRSLTSNTFKLQGLCSCESCLDCYLYLESSETDSNLLQDNVKVDLKLIQP